MQGVGVTVNVKLVNIFETFSNHVFTKPGIKLKDMVLSNINVGISSLNWLVMGIRSLILFGTMYHKSAYDKPDLMNYIGLQPS